ncbi:alpha/beta hydrolase [Roseicitreum antarcticum]|uniref:Acetyl esterase/lipase n=1 Tax=Roseicitreum antarcticum TaxID=564137 RepID=A0A1H2SKG3_9RHOB|nr:alpha/beta hydrolase [Roseicitreum antarcticum]SDW31549.1 Acetyl esterase/lipase [Roseicitreum antarcticum]
MSWQLKVLRVFLRRVAKRGLRRYADSVVARRWFDRGALLNARGRPDRSFIADRLMGPDRNVDALWTAAPQGDDPIVLYFHGGGYIMGSPRTHAALARYIGRKSEAVVCLPAYRLAPEHPFPAAFEDAVLVWEALMARGIHPSQIVLGGDSAGGGLALALLGHLCAHDRPRPAGLFAFSPFTDLTYQSPSLVENAGRDILLPPQRLQRLSQRILQGGDPADPRISPFFASFHGAPPVFIQAARTEILRDDALRMADRLRAFDVDVRCDIWGNLPHVWQFFHGWLPEARAALREVAGFIRARRQSVPLEGPISR